MKKATAAAASVAKKAKLLHGQKLLPGQKKTRRTSHQVQVNDRNKKIAYDNYKRAFKEATTVYFTEGFRDNGRSDIKICEEVNKKYGTFVSH